MPAPLGNRNAVGNTGGRPSKYDAKIPKQAYKLCLLGATDNELAGFFEVNVDTINQWKIDHVEFSDALKKGKAVADANVADKLYQRALGYKHKEDKIFNNDGEALIVPTTKHYPPDATSIIFWLKNRQKAKWKDRHDVNNKIDLTKQLQSMSDEDLEKLAVKLLELKNDNDEQAEQD